MFKFPDWLSKFNLRAWQPKPEDLSGLYAEITINPKDGAVNVEAFNGNGKNCLELTQTIEGSMGGVTERQLKPEANQVKRTADGNGTRATGRSTLSH